MRHRGLSAHLSRSRVLREGEPDGALGDFFGHDMLAIDVPARIVTENITADGGVVLPGERTAG